jgi:AcrR family transcriptional regulator
MSSYANSEATKKALIMAAGALFAEYGIDAVTTRAIAEKAGENTGIIHYHFGSKEGLLNAVMDFAGGPWRSNPLGTFLEANRCLLNTRKGQDSIITQLIRIFFSIHFSPERPSWCCTLAFQILQRDLEISRKTFEGTVRFSINAFIEIYYAISGDHDFERAYNWGIAIIAPAVLVAINPLALKRVHPAGAPSDKFISKLEESCIQNALLTIKFLAKLNKTSQPKNKAEQ